jgi:hypothetical protein
VVLIMSAVFVGGLIHLFVERPISKRLKQVTARVTV